MKFSSKSGARKVIEEYFSKDRLNSKETKKIKKIASSNRISLIEYKKRFCKKCFSDLKLSKIRIVKNYKNTICKSCGYVNKIKGGK